MLVRPILFAVVLALAAESAAAEDASHQPVALTPHYSVQESPTKTDSMAPQPAPTAKVEAAPLGQAAAEPADETVRVTGRRWSTDDSYRLGAGDKLRITVFGEDDLSGAFEIDGQGFVRLPLIGQLPAAGLTAFGLESHIGEAYLKGGYLLSPKVNVEVTGYRPFYILGEVTKPGEYPYVNAMTAENAIALAGGFTDKAVTSSLYVRHQNEPTEREVALDATTRIRPGDVVRVERSSYWSVMTFLQPLFTPFTAMAYLLK